MNRAWRRLLARLAAPGSPPQGFVLIGVVILVLALTILGLSLFSLSSYEGQFLGQSVVKSQALYDAESGLEIVKAVLSASPFQLEYAHLAEGHLGIVRAIARQKRNGVTWDSTGLVVANTNLPVWVQVTAQRNGETRTVEAYYSPGRAKDYYHRLFTAYGPIDVAIHTDNTPTDRCGTTSLTGDIWEYQVGDSNYAGGCVDWIGSSAPHDTVALPDVAGFIAAHAGAEGADFPEHASEVQLGTSGPDPKYYLATNRVGGPADYLYELPGSTLTLRVRGTVVWMFPRGFRCDRPIRIERDGSPTAVLVIVVGPHGERFAHPDDDPEIGFWSFNGIVTGSRTRVVIVSDGKVWLESVENSGTGETSIRNLSVYAKGIRTLGPAKTPPPKLLFLRYGPNMPAVIDDLLARNALPLPTDGSATRTPFALVPNSWRDLTR